MTLAEIEGPGAINHIWITVDAKTTDADCFVLRDLVLRMYWDDEDVYKRQVYNGELEMTGQLHALNYLKWCRGGEFTPTPWEK